MNVPFLELKPAYEEVRAKFDAAYYRVMELGSYLLGRELEAFEAEFPAFCSAKYFKKLNELNEWNERRRQIAARYLNELKSTPDLTSPFVEAFGRLGRVA